MNKTIRFISIISVVSILLVSLSSCDNNPTSENIKLINHMTIAEINSITTGELQILEKPWESSADAEKNNYSEGVFLEIWDNQDWINYYENLEASSQNDYKEDIKSMKQAEYRQSIVGACVDGRYYDDFIMPDINYDGGEGYYQIFDEDYVLAQRPYSNYEELKDILHEVVKDYENIPDNVAIKLSYSESDVQTKVDDILRIFDAVINNDYESLPIGTIYEIRDLYYIPNTVDLSWKFDDEEVTKIKDNIAEYHIYDEELDMDFVVHITTPPDFDSQEKYPAFVMTDAVWRFDDVVSMYNQMTMGNAGPCILVTIGYDYDICSSDEAQRAKIFCENKKGFLDFITNNLMPYLGEIYNINYEDSVLFGHSQGGVFTHYAAFNSDCYDNQPFGKYIIGSPVFWTPYFTGGENYTGADDYEQFKNEYGYFERNEEFTKELFITGGSFEDEDFADYYDEASGIESTLSGIESFKGRLDSYGVTTYEIKLYESHHSEYVSEMILEYFKKHF